MKYSDVVVMNMVGATVESKLCKAQMVTCLRFLPSLQMLD